MAPACISASMFCVWGQASDRMRRPRLRSRAGAGRARTCGFFAISATCVTNATRSFWYFSNVCSTARVAIVAIFVSCLPSGRANASAARHAEALLRVGAGIGCA
jgi:hypothetical protein